MISSPFILGNTGKSRCLLVLVEVRRNMGLQAKEIPRYRENLHPSTDQLPKNLLKSKATIHSSLSTAENSNRDSWFDGAVIFRRDLHPSHHLVLHHY